MDLRVGGTGKGQTWRVTGIRPDDTPPAPARVGLEFWLEYETRNGRRYDRQIKSFDPSLARLLACHLNEMADHAEERNVTNLLRYFDTSKRTQNENIRTIAVAFEAMARTAEEFLPEGAEKTVAMRKLLESKDAACRSALDLPED